MIKILLTSLPDPAIRVVRPLPAAVWPNAGEFLALLDDTSIGATGDTLENAKENLADIVAAKFRLFSRKENVLSEHLQRQLRMLQGHLAMAGS
ncbi:hypothetical protein LCGC14_0728080 [marine sediment metagenome]|uniref:Uncharacterized protein n=1 Tax=marine sediment metagenome TaxID=412755 RepID=A0A0F9SVR4_9ZZZZ